MMLYMAEAAVVLAAVLCVPVLKRRSDRKWAQVQREREYQRLCFEFAEASYRTGQAMARLGHATDALAKQIADIMRRWE